MATVNVNLKIRAPHHLIVGLAACSRAIQSTDRAAAAHARGDDRIAEFWLGVRGHWRGIAERNMRSAAQ